MDIADEPPKPPPGQGGVVPVAYDDQVPAPAPGAR
jgi:hypothetical protein